MKSKNNFRKFSLLFLFVFFSYKNSYANENFFEKGIDELWCLAVNDPFVMYAWGLVGKSLSSIRMVSDGNCELTKKLGFAKDLGVIGLGLRSMRYAMVVENGKVSSVFVEDDPGKLEKSDANSVLASLQ